MYDFQYGRNSNVNAVTKPNPSNASNPYTNNITRRSYFLAESIIFLI